MIDFRLSEISTNALTSWIESLEMTLNAYKTQLEELEQAQKKWVSLSRDALIKIRNNDIESMTQTLTELKARLREIEQ
jgi:hypothetical protein